MIEQDKIAIIEAVNELEPVGVKELAEVTLLDLDHVKELARELSRDKTIRAKSNGLYVAADSPKTEKPAPACPRAERLKTLPLVELRVMCEDGRLAYKEIKRRLSHF